MGGPALLFPMLECWATHMSHAATLKALFPPWGHVAA